MNGFTFPLLLIFFVLLTISTALHVTWLPLGDSITWGCGNGFLPATNPDECELDAGSYRIPTCLALEQWNITVTTLGSFKTGPASQPDAWKNHEGLIPYST